MNSTDSTADRAPVNVPAMPTDFDELQKYLYSAVVCDALDSFGQHHTSPRISLNCLTGDAVLIGRCRTTLWVDMYHEDPQPYEYELQAVDGCRPGDVMIAAAHGSMRSGIWGELLSTAARNGGCRGAIVDGAVRDVTKMREMRFPVFARGTSPYDSRNRQRVVDVDTTIEIDGVVVNSGDLVIADADGIVFIPASIEQQVLHAAWEKVFAENAVRDAIRNGMGAMKAWETFGVL